MSGFSLYQGKKTKKYKRLGPAKLPCYKRVYIRPLYNEVPLYFLWSQWINLLCFVVFFDYWYNKISDITNKISQSQRSCYTEFPLYCLLYTCQCSKCISFLSRIKQLKSQHTLCRNANIQFWFLLCLEVFVHIVHVMCRYITGNLFIMQ